MVNNLLTKKCVNSDYIILFICGLIVLSPVSSFLSQKVLHFPLSLPELFFLPFYFKLRKIFNFKINIGDFVVGLTLITCFIGIAFIINEFHPLSIISTARGYFYIVLIFSIFKNKKIDDINYIFQLALGASFGWMLLGINSINSVINSIDVDQKGLAVYGNMIALALMISILIVFRKKGFFIFIFLIVMIISITAGLRRQIIVAFTAYLLGFITQISFNFKRLLYLLVSISLITVSIIHFYPLSREFISDVSPKLYVRIFIKSEHLLSGDISASDQTRINSLMRFTDEIEKFILPRGFVSKRTINDEKAGLFMDSPYIEFFYTFGILFALFLIFIFFQRVVYHFKNYYINKYRESAICLIMSGIILILMMIEGSFLNFAYTAPFTGFVFARLMSTHNLIK